MEGNAPEKGSCELLTASTHSSWGANALVKGIWVGHQQHLLLGEVESGGAGEKWMDSW